MIQDKAERRAFLTVSKENCFFDLMVVSFENATSHKYVVQKGMSLSRARSERVGYSFLVLIQKSRKSCVENRTSKLLSPDTGKSANSSWAFKDRCVS